MSTKLSLLSRAAAVAGILALALPAVAQTSQPAAPANAAPAVSSPTDKPVQKQTTGEIKIDKDKSHAAKDMTKTGDKKDEHKQSAQAPVAGKTDGAPVKNEAISK
jgi:hypothetical protein